MNQVRGYPTKLIRARAGDREFELLCPANNEELLNDARTASRFESDEYLPYWAALWPCSDLLIREILRLGRATATAPAALDLGCGVGLVTLTLLSLGYKVVAADYDQDALEFVRLNSKRNSLSDPELIHLDWRLHYPALRFPRIFAADVLYETRSLRPVAEFIHNHLDSQGVAFIADPNRSTAEDFATVARHCGLSVSITRTTGTDPETLKSVQGRIFCLARTT